MTNCLLGFSTPFDLTICSNSNLRATKFSATRLPISCGEVPAGQFLKYLDCARALLPISTMNAVAISNASLFDCLSIFTPSNFLSGLRAIRCGCGDRVDRDCVACKTVGRGRESDTARWCARFENSQAAALISSALYRLKRLVAVVVRAVNCNYSARSRDFRSEKRRVGKEC